MKIYTMILIIVLMISTVLPLNVGMELLFYPTEAAEKMNISAINDDVRRAMLVLSVYILSWVILYVMSFAWILKKKREGIALALFLGLITLARGILLVFLFNSHDLGNSYTAMIMITVGLAISISAIFALRETRDLKVKTSSN